MKKAIFRLSFIFIGLMTVSVLAQTVPAPYTLRLKPFLTGLSRPLLVRNAGDGSKRLFIVQQAGVIKVLQPGSTVPTDFINLSSKITIPVTAGDERGLLGMTFHPQFAANGKFYANYTRVGDGATIIAEYKTVTANPNQGDITTERILLTIPQPFANHNGGMIEFGPDGFLYIGMGDGGFANDPGNRAQNPAQLLGKMLRIDVNIPVGSNAPYLIPANNPFTGANTTRCDGGSTAQGNTCQEIWTIGMRNPFRWSFDRGGTRQLWAADVGQNAIEEVDIITGGANYGWRVYEGTQCTGNDPTLCTTPNAYTPPIFQYTHAGGRCSITGGYVYRGTQGSLPTGAYIYADYCTGEILMWQNNQQILLQDTPRFITSFGEDEDGELYVCYSNGQIDRLSRAKASADFDGDFKTDISVFRPSNGSWYILNSSNSAFRAVQFGQNGDVPTPEDFDGDNITDIGVFRPSNGTWYRLNSSDNTFTGIQFGANDDLPAAGDYDGDAKADLVVFRPSNGSWYRLNSIDNSFFAVQFGTNGDVPTPGDFDGDGKYDISVFRPSNGTWYRLGSISGFAGVQFGVNSDVPAQGDFDGDGKTDQAVYRPSAGAWFILRSTNSTVQSTPFGTSGDVASVGDYDGDGRSDIAVFRPSNGTWYYINSSNGANGSVQFGANGDLSAPAYDAP
ncbi:MAG: PQQ-dependent sugar dehydrogenase [Acidobacteria bacterium]|nr:PQQ-dependent sugar dehydrogenase [Acidobacteriota bacterium]